MNRNQTRRGPIPPNQPGQDKIDTAKHNHGEEGIHTVVRMTDREMGEMSYHIDLTQGHSRSNKTDSRVGHRPEHHKTQRGTLPNRPETPNHRHVVVDRDHDNRNCHHHARHRPRALQPDGDRPSDKVVNPCPIIEKSKCPKTDHRKVVAVNWPPQDLGNEVVGGSQRHWRQPQSQNIVGEPPVGDWLHHTSCRHEQDHHLRNRVEPGEPENRGQNIPLRNIHMPGLPVRKRHNSPHPDHCIRKGQNRSYLHRHFKPLHRSHFTGQNTGHPNCHAHVPQDPRKHKETAVPHLGTAQARHQPECHAKNRIISPPENHGVEVRGPDPSESQPLKLSQVLRIVHLIGCDEGKYRPDH
ncbi:MAG: hypothetical protein BWY82_02407 [Verrucomicrobia bacterium ADurb.Bin474]|nr:MAG: hypothetical protein BWY82_02407 [Verrucomicrobia bacterium ADurb.Bin474]